MALNLNIIFRDFRVLLRFSDLKSDLKSHRRTAVTGLSNPNWSLVCPAAGGGELIIELGSLLVSASALENTTSSINRLMMGQARGYRISQGLMILK